VSVGGAHAPWIMAAAADLLSALMSRFPPTDTPPALDTTPVLAASIPATSISSLIAHQNTAKQGSERLHRPCVAGRQKDTERRPYQNPDIPFRPAQPGTHAPWPRCEQAPPDARPTDECSHSSGDLKIRLTDNRGSRVPRHLASARPGRSRRLGRRTSVGPGHRGRPARRRGLRRRTAALGSGAGAAQPVAGTGPRPAHGPSGHWDGPPRRGELAPRTQGENRREARGLPRGAVPAPIPASQVAPFCGRGVTGGGW